MHFANALDGGHIDNFVLLLLLLLLLYIHSLFYLGYLHLYSRDKPCP